MSRYIDADYFLKEYCEPYPEVYKAMSAAIKHMPPADVVPVRHGHWIRTGLENIYGGIELVCSECGDHVMVQHIEDELYCRHCGAYMFGEGKEE